jgi:hypothetical protein
MQVTIARRCRGWGRSEAEAGAAAGGEPGAAEPPAAPASASGGSLRRVDPKGSQLDDDTG